MTSILSFRVVPWQLPFLLAVGCLLSMRPLAHGSEDAEIDPVRSFREYLDRGGELAETAKEPFAALSLTADQAKAVAEVVTRVHRDGIRETRKAEHEAKRIELDGLTMKYGVSVFGKAPAKGHSLYLSMHGGGGAPPAVNDQQWGNQQRLYQLEEGIYVAPRAPTDTWDLWHQPHIDRFFARLIENMIALEGVNPDRIYLTGYSAGGDGVFQLAPRMADRFAAAAMMAGHPNETQPLGLRNLPFTLHMGERDAAYNRNQQAEKWKRELAALREQDPMGYEHWVEIHPGKGHWMDRQDAAGVKWMAKFERDLGPRRVVWLQDNVLQDRFYWLAVSPTVAKGGDVVEVTRDANHFSITRSDARELSILLRDDIVDFDQPIVVEYRGERLHEGVARRTIADIVSSLIDRGDPLAIFTGRVTVTLPKVETSGRSDQAN